MFEFHEFTQFLQAYGADADKCFGIRGEDLKGVISARNFVGWYNGLPQDKAVSNGQFLLDWCIKCAAVA